MGADEKDFLDDKKLQAFIKSLKNIPVAKVGILGDKNARADGPTTNAEIGKKHEFGEDGMPARSFLRVPISEQMQRYLDKSGAFTVDSLKEILKTKTLKPWVMKFAITAEAIVQDGFDSGGFGAWPPSNMEHKKVQMTLVETQQLRNSVTSEVK
jgi:hypothetical protein